MLKIDARADLQGRGVCALVCDYDRIMCWVKADVPWYLRINYGAGVFRESGTHTELCGFPITTRRRGLKSTICVAIRYMDVCQAKKFQKWQNLPPQFHAKVALG